MMTFLFLAVLALLGLLCFTGPDGMVGPRHRHRVEFATTRFRWGNALSGKACLIELVLSL